MKLLSIEHAVPDSVVTNDDIIDVIRDESRELSEFTLSEIERRLRRYWRATGTRLRHVSSPGDRVIDLALDAARKACSSGAVDPADIDLVIYVGVGRPVLEPATASLIQYELGLKASCFDILEACQSWLRALQIARSMIRAHEAHTVLIVNCEAGLWHLGDFRLSDEEEVERIAASTTVGEAATATIVSESDEDDFYFKFANLGEYFGLCMIPLSSYENFLGPFDNPWLKPEKFYADSTELMRVMAIDVVAQFKEDKRLRASDYDAVFFHQASERIADYIRRRIGIEADKCVHTHAEFGNTVSATVPLSMSLALQENRLSRGDRTLIVTGAAGVSIGFASFTF